MNHPTIRTGTVARVTVTLEVEVGSWGPDCDLSQIYRQGSEAAVCKIHNMISGSRYHGIRIVSTGPVEALTTKIEVRK